jgi:class 3 adenylate cyclase
MTATRRLAAILAADIAGYSRLMGADEQGTLARLKTLRAKLIDPAIPGTAGRWQTRQATRRQVVLTMRRRHRALRRRGD